MAQPLCTASGRPIGFRRTRSAWQQDLSALLRFAADAGFAFLDYGPVDAAVVRQSQQEGVPVGTVDLLNWQAMLAPDSGLRSAAVVENASHVRSLVEAGVTTFLTVLAPPQPQTPRAESFALAVHSYQSLGRAAAECGAVILIEGAPGRPPHFANLACTPADLRAFLSAVDSPAIGVSFDPSHLVRMNIDPSRFLREFGPHIRHVHAKDTLFIEQERYDHGTLQQATFAEPHLYGGFGWRYVLPGKGVIRWPELLKDLAAIGYAGGISIELEDQDVLGPAASEQQGLRQAAAFLAGLP